MPPRRSGFLLSFAAALVVAGVWLALGGSDAQWGVPGDSHPQIAPPPAPTPTPSPAAAPLPEVLVEIVATARLLRLAARPTPPLGTWVAGPASLPSTRTLAPGPQLLRIGGGAAPTYRVVQVDAAPPELPQRPAGCAFAGRVVDEAGAPIAGVRAWLGGRTAASDADGRFRFEGIDGGRGVPLVLRAAGRASSFEVVDVAPQPTPAVFVLEPGAALEVQFAGRLPSGAPPRALVLPAGAPDSRAQRFPFFLQGEAAPDLAGVALDAQGRCRLEGLPLDTELRLVVWHPLLAAPAVTVRLRRPIQPATVMGRSLEAVSGSVVDDVGAPLGGVVVSSQPQSVGVVADFGAQWLLPPAAYLPAAATTMTTTADGSFRIGRHPAGSLVQLASVGHFGLQVTAAGEVAGRTFTLPRETPPSGGPELCLVADRPARLRVREGDHTWPVAIWSGDAYTVPWREPVLADVVVTVVPGAGGAPKRTTHRNVAVCGTVELSIALPP